MMRSLSLVLALLAAAPAVAQPAAGRVYELNEVEVLPRPQNGAEFAAALRESYPQSLREAGVGGTVHVSFVLGPDGQPGDVHVVSTPDSAFNAPTEHAVSLLRFTPAQVQGQPVAVHVEQPITWRAEPAAVAATAPVAPESGASGNAEDGYELSAVDELPRPVNGPVFARSLAREYPASMRNAGTSARVVVRFLVGVDGSTSRYTITRTTHTAFNQPTLRALQALRFRPARLNGQPVKVWVEQPIEWVVNGVGGMPPLYQPRPGRLNPMPNPCSVGQC